jgi:hypothetical protein
MGQLQPQVTISQPSITLPSITSPQPKVLLYLGQNLIPISKP